MPHTSATITLGRDKAATIPLDDPESSRIHTAIRYWDDMFVIRDMNSRNGTFVNGAKIDVVRLNPGDKIKIGNTELRTQVEVAAAVSDVTVSMQPAPFTPKG